MIVEKQMECIHVLAGETEVLGENLPQHHFCPYSSIAEIKNGRIIATVQCTCSWCDA
jgi:hypothetical protein